MGLVLYEGPLTGRNYLRDFTDDPTVLTRWSSYARSILIADDAFEQHTTAVRCFLLDIFGQEIIGYGVHTCLMAPLGIWPHCHGIFSSWFFWKPRRSQYTSQIYTVAHMLSSMPATLLYLRFCEIHNGTFFPAYNSVLWLIAAFLNRPCVLNMALV